MLVLTSSGLWAPTQELDFRRYPLRRSYAAGTAPSLIEGATRRSGWSEETRTDPVPPVLEETDHSGVSKRVRPGRQGSVGRTTTRGS